MAMKRMIWYYQCPKECKIYRLIDNLSNFKDDGMSLSDLIRKTCVIFKRLTHELDAVLSNRYFNKVMTADQLNENCILLHD